MTKYLTPNDPDAFLDFPSKQLSSSFNIKDHVPCWVCKGHGGWNLRINAYRLPDGYPDTPENRHLYVHFRTLCNNCNGHGYVWRDDMCSDEEGHQWKQERNVGRCLNAWKCTSCGKEITVDSSD